MMFPDEKQAINRWRRRLSTVINEAQQGRPDALNTWLDKAQSLAKDHPQDARVRFPDWSHNGSPNRTLLSAEAPLIQLLENDLPAAVKAHAVRITETILRYDAPNDRLFRYFGGVMESTWLSAIDVPEVLAFMRQHIPACRSTGHQREDWSFKFLDIVLQNTLNRSNLSPSRQIAQQRLAHLWSTAVDAGMVRENALIDRRTGFAGLSIGPGINMSSEYTLLEVLAVADTSGHLVNHWLTATGTSPAFVVPASGTSLLQSALRNPSPCLLRKWVEQEPSLWDVPMPVGRWVTMDVDLDNLRAPSSIRLAGGRSSFSAAMMDAAQDGPHASLIKTWLQDPIPTLRTTLNLVGQIVSSQQKDANFALLNDPWHRWVEHLLLHDAISNTTSLLMDQKLPRKRL